MLWTLCLVVAVPLLGFLEELSERWGIQAESSPGQPRFDLLEQPAVAIGIAERGERSITGMIGRRAVHATTPAVALELGSRSARMKDVADLRTAPRQLVTGCLDVGDDQVQALRRARRRR